MAYIATDRSGRFLLGASYPGHKVTVNPIVDGVVQAPKQIVPTPPNAHAILPDSSNRHVLVPSLGGDTLLHFRFDAATGTLSQRAERREGQGEGRAASFPLHQGREVRLSAQRAGRVGLCSAV